METLGEVPSESTFSRAFGQFSSDNRPQTIHAALIKTHDGEKIAGHISRDATAIHAREKAVAKARPEEKTKSKPGAESNGGKRGRPPKPCATASAARPKGSTPICTSNTEDGMCACVARSRWLHTSPLRPGGDRRRADAQNARIATGQPLLHRKSRFRTPGRAMCAQKW